MSLSAILLAAGESTRMGCPKAMLDWFGKPLVNAQIESLTDSGVDEILVITGKSDKEVNGLIQNISKVYRVFNPDFQKGKTTSIRIAMENLKPEVNNILILGVDQPRPSWVIHQVIKSHLKSRALITSPKFEHRGGHPLIFSVDLKKELSCVTEEGQGIREIFRRYEKQVNYVNFATELIRLDLNTPEDYEKGLRVYDRMRQ